MNDSTPVMADCSGVMAAGLSPELARNLRIAGVFGFAGLTALAAQVAQAMVVALRRGPNDPEFSPFLHHRNHLHPALHRVQDAVGQQPRLTGACRRWPRWRTPRHAI